MSVHSRPPTTSAPADDAPTFDARDLLSGADRARIVLEDQVYTLRITRAGKLILTK
ncbi:hemin uptake protein HemP [Roseovarius spongiae]|uniref:Hemin uptake protein HemP n=1 Tax=Roseovarius spongiae TaxID=2320272 RepID=A0A3A8AUM7_9RHOB|nr:hemin uptake protein HemP [Roseovarius spongiae]RKF13803.1 hemin uptake protein HemP [Roseovarius spongiae]